jgi:hypothetical protein
VLGGESDHGEAGDVGGGGEQGEVGSNLAWLRRGRSIRPYERGWLSRDLVAGVTLAALAIPEVMEYTKIVGTPVQAIRRRRPRATIGSSQSRSIGVCMRSE